MDKARYLYWGLFCLNCAVVFIVGDLKMLLLVSYGLLSVGAGLLIAAFYAPIMVRAWWKTTLQFGLLAVLLAAFDLFVFFPR